MRKHRKTRRERKKQKKIIIFSSICLLFVMSTMYATFQTNINITAKGNIIDRSRTIQSWTLTSNEDFHTDFYRENIITATFLNNNTVPSNAVKSWDVSENKDKGVIAYVTENPVENGKYDLYIGANDGVIANKDSKYLFYRFANLNSINFNKNFDTINTTKMDCMFAGGNSLTTLDISDFNTRNVVSMKQMFSAWDSNTNDWGNRTMTEIIFGNNFTTANVTTMSDMFAGQPLKSLDLNNFDTSNVITMFHMFNGCSKLTELNLCSFNTNNVTNMASMFSATPNLQKVYVGPNWAMVNADTTNMWANSKTSSVTTGEC